MAIKTAQTKWNGLKMAQTKWNGLKMAKNEMKWPKMVQNKGEIINLEYARENIEKPNVWIGTISCF